MLKRVRIRFSRLGIEFDRDYGIDSKTGWSISMDDSYLTQLVRCPITAVVMSFCVYWARWDKEAREFNKKNH